MSPAYGTLARLTGGGAAGARSAQDLDGNFMWMALAFSINHGVATAPLIVASTLLGGNLSYIGNGTFFTGALASSLFLAAPIVHRLGTKAALVLGLALYCVYIGGFALVLAMQAGRLAWASWVCSSFCGGVAGGILWTAQGAFFSAASIALEEAGGPAREAAAVMLASRFSGVYLAAEVAAKLAFSGLQVLGWSSVGIAWLYFAVATASAVTMMRVQALPEKSPVGRADVAAGLSGMASLWWDPRIWLLSPTNLTFGFCAAFMNGQVNAHIVAAELGDGAVAFLGAITALVAVVFALGLEHITKYAGYGAVVAFGAMCFLCIPLCVLHLGCCAGWGWWVAVLYVAQGLGRAVYEATNRAVFADFFQGARSEDAFANCALQSNAAFAASFFLQSSLTRSRLAAVVMSLAAATPVCFGAAQLLQRRARGLKEGPSP